MFSNHDRSNHVTTAFRSHARSSRGVRRSALIRNTIAVAIALASLAGRASAAPDATLISSARWSGWHQRGGTTDVSISVVENQSGGELLFGKGGNDRRVYFADNFPGPTTVAWQTLGTLTTYQPITGAYLAGIGNYAFARGDDGLIWYSRRGMSGGNTWTAWAQVPGSPYTGLNVAPVSTGDRLFLFAVRTDQQIAYTSMQRSTGIWDAWRIVGGTTNVAVNATVADGKIYVFSKGGIDRRVYLNVLTPSAGSGALTSPGWSELPGGGRTDTSIAAANTWRSVNDGSELITAVMRGDDRLMYLNRRINGVWSGWTVLPGGGTTNAAPSVASINRNLVVLHRGDDYRIYENIYQPRLYLERELYVPANVAWVDTGIDLLAGALIPNVAITTAGQWSNAGTIIGANGQNVLNAYALLPSAPFGSLVGKIGARTFAVGGNFLETAPVSGRLYLSVNDLPWAFGDNTGGMWVTVAGDWSIRATVTVSANVQWMYAGIAGCYDTKASGLWSNAGPASLGPNGYANYRYPGTLVANANLASLVGWIDYGFFLGASASMNPTQRPLYLSINDVPGTFGDNQGSMTVSATTSDWCL